MLVTAAMPSLSTIRRRTGCIVSSAFFVWFLRSPRATSSPTFPNGTSAGSGSARSSTSSTLRTIRRCTKVVTSRRARTPPAHATTVACASAVRSSMCLAWVAASCWRLATWSSSRRAVTRSTTFVLVSGFRSPTSCLVVYDESERGAVVVVGVAQRRNSRTLSKVFHAAVAC